MGIKGIFVLYFCLLPLLIFGQQSVVVKGKVIDEQNKPIEGASILIHPKGEVNSILSYAISDKEGAFSIELAKTRNGLELTAMSLSYADKTVELKDFTTPIVMQLTVEVQKLEEVVVKAQNIRMNDDTIVYRVGAFATEKDRSIGEVIARMPGFAVSSNGRIEYQGKAIEKYYIEGLDLLEGRYGLANNNLPHGAVASIEVLENHQPIKMLDNLVFSDKTSLNIRLKNKVAVTGTAKLGIGASPLLWDTNLTPMFFSKNQQAIASYQANNVGNDIGRQLQTLSFSAGSFLFSDSKKKLLSVLGASSPQIKEDRFLDNNIHLATYNHLLRLKSNAELKINTSYLNDYRQEKGQEIINYYTQNKDAIRIEESIYKREFSNYLKTDFIFNQNVKQHYIKDKLSIQKYWDSEKSVLGGTNTSNQNADNPYLSVSNDLEWMQPFRNKTLKIHSNIHYGKAPQYLHIVPGVLNKLLNDGVNATSVQQNWEERTFSTKHSLQFSLNKNRWSFDTEVGLNTENNTKKTSIAVNDVLFNQEGFLNDLQWNYSKSYVKERIRYETGSFFLRLGLPLSWENYDISDRGENQKKSVFLLQPSLGITHKLTPFWTWGASTSYNKSFSDMNALHYGYILQSYRTILREKLPLNATEIWNSSLNIKYKNPISGFFASGEYWRTKRNREGIRQTQLDANGSIEYKMLEKKNSSTSNILMLKTSKIVADWGTTFFLSASCSNQKSESILTNELIMNNYKEYTLSPKISFGYFNWFTLDYEFTFKKGEQKNKILERSYQNQIHNLEGSFYWLKSHSLTIGLEDYITRTDKEKYTTPFFNLSYNYRWSKKKIDFSVKCNNLLNRKKIERYYSSDISEIISSYQLRPRQILFSVRMSLGGN